MTTEDDAQRLWLLLSLRRHRDLEGYARECVARHPEWGVPYSYLGQALADLGRPKEGIEPAIVGVGKCPEDPWAHATLACVLLRAKKYERAAEAAEEAVRLDPRYPWGYALLADAERNLRAYHRSVRVARRGLAVNPDYEPLLVELGWGLVELGKTDEANGVAARGLEQHPNSPCLHNLAGWVCHLRATRTDFLRMSLYSRAERHFAEAVRGNPTEPAYRKNREQNAIVARRCALKFALLAGGLLVGPQILVAVLALRANGKFAIILSAVVPQLLWLIAVIVWASESRIALLTAPLDRFGIPTIPLLPAARRRGRLLWRIALSVELALILVVAGVGIYAACSQ